MKTTVINIFGAPGSGKSTLAAELYAEMKKQGYSVELVREAIKPWAYEGKKPTVFEQIYITNKQMLEETSLYGKVAYLITDSPIPLGDFYCNYYHKSDALHLLNHSVVKNAFETGLINNHDYDFFIPLNKDTYNTEGRYSSLDQSKEIEKEMLSHVLCLDWAIKLNNPETRCKEALGIICGR